MARIVAGCVQEKKHDMKIMNLIKHIGTSGWSGKSIFQVSPGFYVFRYLLCGLHCKFDLISGGAVEFRGTTMLWVGIFVEDFNKLMRFIWF